MPEASSPDDHRFGNAIQIADRVWWVGRHRPGDIFQCHAYLIEHGDQSVLVDPGSPLTIDETLHKVAEVVPLDRIRYLLCHHPDPDIASALPALERVITRPDAAIITQWRSEPLIRHYDVRLPFWRIDDHAWRLDLGDRTLRFIFTPYLHFPGAFCTFDEHSGTLFTSDLFGGFDHGDTLIASDEGCFEGIRAFHEHYMPSRDILVQALIKLQALPIRTIAPQHGVVIPQPLVGPVIDRLKEIECGLYLIARHDTDLDRLLRLNQALRDLVQTMIVNRDFRNIATGLIAIARRLLPIEAVDIYVAPDSAGHSLRLASRTRYRGVSAPPPPACAPLFGLSRGSWQKSGGSTYRRLAPPSSGTTERGPTLLLPLFTHDDDTIEAVALLHLAGEIPLDGGAEELLGGLARSLSVAVEREAVHHLLETERRHFYQRSIRDPLTGLYTRLYMEEAAQRLLRVQDRDSRAGIALALFDIDHFKRINDQFGHACGDEVLRRVSAVIRDGVRASDIAVRMGGEEFAVILISPDGSRPVDFAERIRARIGALTFDGAVAGLHVTVSAGVAIRQPVESLDSVFERADAALYVAKRDGRDRTCAAEVPG